MKPNLLKKKLNDGKFCAGTWVSLCSPIAAEVIGLVGFDWVLIDMEHGAGDYQTLLTQLQAIEAAGDTTPIVRVQWNDAVVIKRVLDAGAYGVMVPGIKTVEEAKRAIGAIKYPPEGFRGIASVRGAKYGVDGTYLKEANNEMAMFLQIETTEAVENVNAILDLPGIDVCFIGPNDLSADMGHTGNMAHPDVQAAIKKVEDAANARNIPLGTVSGGWDQAKGLVDKGYRAMSIASDIRFLLGAAQSAMTNFREHTK